MQTAGTGTAKSARDGEPRTAPAPSACLWIIDDDAITRELLVLVANETGFQARSFASGEDALGQIAQESARKRPEAILPRAILIDMQMPGLSGANLAAKLRTVCEAATALLAMSGSEVQEEQMEGFDGFLLKPFTSQALGAALSREGESRKPTPVLEAGALDEDVYAKLARSMTATQLSQLYRMCLDDVRKRLDTMRLSVETGDDAVYRRAAHAIKGGCGMVGATALARLAGECESHGIAREGDGSFLESFHVAMTGLERMLDRKQTGSEIATADTLFSKI